MNLELKSPTKKKDRAILCQLIISKNNALEWQLPSGEPKINFVNADKINEIENITRKTMLTSKNTTFNRNDDKNKSELRNKKSRFSIYKNNDNAYVTTLISTESFSVNNTLKKSDPQIVTEFEITQKINNDDENKKVLKTNVSFESKRKIRSINNIEKKISVKNMEINKSSVDESNPNEITLTHLYSYMANDNKPEEYKSLIFILEEETVHKSKLSFELDLSIINQDSSNFDTYNMSCLSIINSKLDEEDIENLGKKLTINDSKVLNEINSLFNKV